MQNQTAVTFQLVHHGVAKDLIVCLSRRVRLLRDPLVLLLPGAGRGGAGVGELGSGSWERPGDGKSGKVLMTERW